MYPFVSGYLKLATFDYFSTLD